MISYPLLERNATIGVTAPSSGVSEEHHSLLESALKRMEEKSFQVVTGKTLWTQDKEKSGPARKRADEFNQMMQDEKYPNDLSALGRRIID